VWLEGQDHTSRLVEGGESRKFDTCGKGEEGGPKERKEEGNILLKFTMGSEASLCMV